MSAIVLRSCCREARAKELKVPLADTVNHRSFASLKLVPSSMQRLWHPDCPKCLIEYGALRLSMGPSSLSPAKQMSTSCTSPKLLIRTPALGGRFCLRNFHKRCMQTFVGLALNPPATHPDHGFDAPPAAVGISRMTVRDHATIASATWTDNVRTGTVAQSSAASSWSAQRLWRLMKK